MQETFFHSLLKFSSRFLYRCNSFIIPHFLKFVKRFFKTFFKVFASLHLTKPLAVFDSLSLLSAPVLAHFRFLYPLHYSSFNLRFFAMLRGFLFLSRLTTILLYHTFLPLSTPFFPFFRVWKFCPFSIKCLCYFVQNLYMCYPVKHIQHRTVNGTHIISRASQYIIVLHP